MFRRQSRLCDLFVLNRIKKVRFSTKSLHIWDFQGEDKDPQGIGLNIHQHVWSGKRCA